MGMKGQSSTRWSSSMGTETWSGSSPKAGLTPGAVPAANRNGSSWRRWPNATAGSFACRRGNTLNVVCAWASVLLGFGLFQGRAGTVPVTLVWTTVTNAENYKVYKSLNGAPWAFLVATPETTMSGQADAGTNRWYVTAWNASGESDPSN